MPVGLSRFTQIVLHQGRIERFFLDHIKKHSKDSIHVERAVLPESLDIVADKCDDHSANSYPITVKLRHLTEEESTPAQSNGSSVRDGLFRSNLADDDTDELLAKSKEKQGSTETVKAKYVVGCDGAHSWTRRQLGFQLEGEPTDFIWGVLGNMILNLKNLNKTNNFRRHTYYGLPRYSHAMRCTQRLVRLLDGHSSRE